MANEFPISNVVRVTVSLTERAVKPKNINEIALFTHEQPNNSDEYMIAVEPSSITEAYGTNSLTAKMVQNIFAQSKNPITGGGYVAVIPMQGTKSATPASFKMTVAGVESFKNVTDGSLKITTGGQSYSLNNLNFSQVATLNDVMTVLGNATNAVWWAVDGSTLTATAKDLGTGSAVTFSSGEGGTDITAADYLNVAEGETTAGTNASGETIEMAIDRIKGKVRFTGVLSTVYFEDAVVQATASFMQSDDYLFLNVWTSPEAINGAVKTIQSATQTHTRCLVYTMGLDEAKLALAAYAGRAFSTNFEGSGTSQTMNLKTLANVTPDTGLDQTDYLNAKTNGADLYVSYEGYPGVLSTGGNRYFDTIYETMALKFNIQARLFSSLRSTTTKIPQTEDGVAVLRDAIGNVFEQFVRVGCVAPGTWNSADTFGDPEVFRENIQNQGWYVYSTPISEQSQAQREQRIAPALQGAAKMAGAIHEADVLIVVEE